MNKHYTFGPKLLAFIIMIMAGVLVNSVAWAQATVTGKVLDEAGQPLPGVNVVEKGTSSGTTTTASGEYSIRVTTPQPVLVFSFVGYQPQEIAVNNQAVISPTLALDNRMLNEVVVVGYGTQQKKDLTGSIASADLVAFKESPNVSILQSLKGSLPGLTIGQTNRAGQEASINIRGTSTLNGNTSPLIIVDGIIYSGRLSDINPADVASVDVLKDPSSKAVYGSQAANGVVLITTKNGKSGQKPSITYSGNYAISTPTIGARLLGREAYLQKVRDIEYLNSYTKESGYTQPNPAWTYANSDFFPSILAGVDAGNDYDWFGALTQPSLISNHTLGLSGGSDRTTYFMSAGYTNEKGFIKNDDYTRLTLRLNLDTEVTKWLTIGANTSGAFTDFSGEAPNMSSLIAMSPLVLPTDAEGNYIINPTGDLNTNPFLPATNDNYEMQNRLVGNFYGIIRIPSIPGFSYRLNVGNNLKFFKNYGSSIYGAGQTGSAYKNDAIQYEQTLDNIFNYTRSFGKHSINATGVYGYNTARFNRTAANGSGFSDLNLSYNNLAQAEIQKIASEAWNEALLYQMGSVAYNYGGKYLLKATVRRDGFSGFSRNNKTGIFPSLGFGWVLSEEDFFKVPVVDFLKIRGSYGENGNKVGRYSSLARVESADGSKYVFGDGGTTAIGRSVATLANNDLRWERTRGINIGADFAILNSRIDGNVEYYNSNTNDLLWSQVLPQTSGFGSVLTNIGEINNTGIEFMLHGVPFQTNDFTWDLSVNFSRNRNKIVSLLGEDLDGDGKEDDLIASGLFIGRPIGTIYSYQIDGLNGLDNERLPGFDPGSYKVIDQNADGKITPEADRIILGQREPAFQFGIQNNVSYKQFTLRFFINSIQGGKNGYLSVNHPDGYNGTKGIATSSNWFDFNQIWSPRTPDAKYPNPWVGSPVGARAYYQRDFVRLQDISLAYNFDKVLSRKIGAQNIKLFVSGKNLLTLTDWDGWDPETGQGVSNYEAFPVMKSYSFGLDITF
ncbi:SusC/RagA family TonB-linked outer membrane protein [Telluribacter humicola]|uniref:SusC/RagA family TonB-linked outer membrane protein n=1 Tax=Telluribacter humicola TaxID=1720261 RepID=UPI001E47D701|nr:TonB-dependent receptor [Telluribacter humicola]